MSKGIYTAVSGAIAQSARLDTIANNLANLGTHGFKRDQQVFREYLTSYEKGMPDITAPRIPASIESFYNMQGGDKSYVDLAGTATIFEQGILQQTGNPLDLAIEGDGFFEVETPNGTMMTRQGNFKMNALGELVNGQGHPVILEDGTNLTLANGSREIAVTPEGYIFVDNVVRGRLSIVSVENKDALHKIGNSLYVLRENFDPELLENPIFKIHQGYLESSNVNALQEMAEMINATRTFEATQKAIQAYDRMSEQLTKEVPRI